MVFLVLLVRNHGFGALSFGSLWFLWFFTGFSKDSSPKPYEKPKKPKETEAQGSKSIVSNQQATRQGRLNGLVLITSPPEVLATPVQIVSRIYCVSSCV